MKTILKLNALLPVALISLIQSAFGQEMVKVNNFIYEIKRGSVTNFGYEGEMSNGSISIPSSIIVSGSTLPVTSIGLSAYLAYGESLSTVIIPSSVATIGDNAFSDCYKLSNILIPPSITILGGWSFARCYSLTSLTIPSSVTSIGEDAFGGCTKLTSVKFPGNAPSMGANIFNGCSPNLIIYYYNGTTGFTSPHWTDRSGNRYTMKRLDRFPETKE